MMDGEEWQRIAKGIRQRAQILNFIMSDVYDKRELISKGIIPHEVIFCHKAFLRQCNKLFEGTQKHLSFYAADIARGPNGRIWVINDRTQAPSGMGYALENRLTMGRVAPELFTDMHVRKLSAFYSRFKEMLKASAPRQKEEPLIVLLTPGPHNETYFEQAYLASFLDLPLVQGADLVVRNNCLWLKSLKGLKQVDVVLRRVDEEYCDPLELFSESRLGIAGLMTVIRRKNVTIINPIGSGILENRGLLPFMAGVAKYYLGEELILPQIATWWCGQKKEMDFVLEHLDSVVVKRIDRTQGKYIYIGDELSSDQLQTLKDQINAEPHLFVGQEKVSFSTAPNLQDGQIVPRNAVIRAYAVASEHSYEIMPGGLVRVAPMSGNSFVTGQSGGTSKDIWINGAKPETTSVQPIGAGNTWAIISGLDDLPSQTAENLFWTGRYVGRTLILARFLRMVYQKLTDSNYNDQDISKKSLQLLLQTLTHLTATYPGFVGEGHEKLFADPKAEVDSLITSRTRAGSLSHGLELLANSCFSLRSLLSASAWRVFDRMNTKWNIFLTEANFNNQEVIRSLDQLITRCVAFMSLIEESILPDQGLLLYSIGLDTEESLLTISKFRALLVVQMEMQLEHEILEALLISLESLNIYRYTYRSYLKPEHILDLVLLDIKYPRSVTYKINNLVRNLQQMPQARNSNRLTEYQKPTFRAFSMLQLTNSTELMELDESSIVRHKLDELLGELTELIFIGCNSLSENYFTHVQQQSLTHDPKTEF
jgi:uncharacterized circularly permuted ATP-grasp superfamily protein/uncharacterized alpha-E superfamily protein